MCKIASPPRFAPAQAPNASAQRVCKKYRKERLRKMQKREIKNLKKVVPSVAKQDNIPKITVIEEAIKYIDELHAAIAQRFMSGYTTSHKSMLMQMMNMNNYPAPQLQTSSPQQTKPLSARENILKLR